MKPTYLEQLDTLPPIICWLLAREPRRGAGIPLTKQHIAKQLGWPISNVKRICALWSWSTVSVQDADAFRRACGIPRHKEREQFRYLKESFHRQRGFAHVKSPQKVLFIEKLRLGTA